MEIMSKAQECLIKCLRLSGMTISQISEIVEMLWEEEATLEMLEYILKTRETDQDKLYSIACEISEKYKSEETE